MTTQKQAYALFWLNLQAFFACYSTLYSCSLRGRSCLSHQHTRLETPDVDDSSTKANSHPLVQNLLTEDGDRNVVPNTCHYPDVRIVLCTVDILGAQILFLPTIWAMRPWADTPKLAGPSSQLGYRLAQRQQLR